MSIPARPTVSVLLLLGLSPACAATVPLEQHVADMRTQEQAYEERLRRAQEDYARSEKAAEEERSRLQVSKGSLEERVAALESGLGEKQRTLDDVTTQLLELQDAFSKLSSKERSQIEAHLTREKQKQAALAGLELRFEQALGEELKAGKIEVSIKDESVVVRFKDGALFGKGSSRLSSSAKGVVDRLASAIAAEAELQVRIEAHTDAVRPKDGDAADTWALTHQQGLSLAQALSKAGVDPTRIAYTSLGQFRPAATNDTPEGRASNRRVEVILSAPRPR